MRVKGWTDPSASTTQSLAHLLSQVEHRVTRELGRVLEDASCTVERWRTLMLLADNKSHAMSEIGEFALIPGPSLTRVIDRMVADNLAYRNVDPTDRRRVLVHITPRGRALYHQLARRIDSERDAILADGDADAGDLEQLAALLGAMMDRLRDAQ